MGHSWQGKNNIWKVKPAAKVLLFFGMCKKKVQIVEKTALF